MKPQEQSTEAAWFTKEAAARTMGVSGKTVENLVKAGRLRQTMQSRPGRPPIAVYHPEDVQKESEARAAVRAETATAATPSTTSSAGAVMVRSPAPTIETWLQSMNRTTEPVPLEKKRFLTVSEAARYSGLGESFLGRLIDAGHLKAIKGAGPRGARVVARAELDTLELPA